MKNVRLPVVVISMTCLLLPLPRLVLGMASVDQCATRGTPIDVQTAQFHGWPAGVRELLNSPLRGNGWHPWFSECANDWTYYPNLNGFAERDVLWQRVTSPKRRKLALHARRENACS